ncbi:MAG: restriction endonuclease subunit S, partial [Gallionella sp.]|nr:restriction endonuclease subunit S [Gallionella sp.]
ECKLEEVSTVQTGPFGSQLHQSDYQLVGTPIITVEHLGENKILHQNIPLVSDEDKERLNKYVLEEGDIVFSRVGSVDRRAYVSKNEEGWMFSGRCLRVRVNKEIVDPKYLSYYFGQESFKEHIRMIAVGATMPSINTEILSGVGLNLPTLPEQHSIASILSSLDDKIDLLHRQNKTLEAMAATLFRQWFMEEAHEDWEDGTLGEAVEIFDGQRIPLSRMERDKKKDGILYPYYGAAQIMDYINDYIFDGEYILLGEDGTVRTDEGYPVLQFATGKFWVNNHTHVLKAKAPYSNFFLWNYLSRTNIDEIVTGAVQPKINQGNLKSLVFPRCPKNLVVEFNRITEPVLAKIQHNKSQIAGLEELRDTLLPKLMSGEVRVVLDL